jgi:radical SAM superfamily enzyme YgiQ (UPF0313 family)
MKIGLIAMSGIRAHNEDLMRAGLSMPAVVERGVVVASLPSLSLLTLAALTPPEFDIEYHEIKDLRTAPELPGDFDLVAISTFTAQVKDAYAVADHYRSAGVAVVMGGLHVKSQPEEAAEHCTAIAVGEGEVLWPRIVDDFRNGALRPRYDQAAGEYYDLAEAPIPRYDLLDIGKYNRLTVQTSRGCPHCCDFCAGSILLTPKYAVKPVDRVIAEIRAIKRLWARPFIEFADDNSFVDRARAKALLTALRGEDIRWFTETDVSIADDIELLDLMRASGCRQVLIGLESPQPQGLDGIEVKRNWKLARLPDYEAAVRKIQSRGVTVNGCFILGLDGDSEETFDAIYDFVDRTALFEAQITVLTAFPGTPVYDRLAAEGRLIEPEAWEKCTLFDVNFHPKNMSAEALQRGLVELAGRLYDSEFVNNRRRRFFEQLEVDRVGARYGLG